MIGFICFILCVFEMFVSEYCKPASVIFCILEFQKSVFLNEQTKIHSAFINTVMSVRGTCLLRQSGSGYDGREGAFLNEQTKIHSAFINTVMSVRGTLVPITSKNPLSLLKRDGPISGHPYQFLDIVGSISGNLYHFLDSKKFNEFRRSSSNFGHHYQFPVWATIFRTLSQHRDGL